MRATSSQINPQKQCLAGVYSHLTRACDISPIPTHHHNHLTHLQLTQFGPDTRPTLNTSNVTSYLPPTT